MGNWIAGLVAMALIIAFLGGMALGIGALPFTVIVVGVLLMIVIEFIETVVKGRDRTGSSG